MIDLDWRAVSAPRIEPGFYPAYFQLVETS